MIVVRGVFQAKYGRSDELVQLLKEGNAMWPRVLAGRILTDLSGQFFTVVSEATFENLAEWEAQGVFRDPRFGPWFERMQQLVESGRREFYTLVE